MAFKDQQVRRTLYRSANAVHKIQRELNDKLRGTVVQLTRDAREWHGGRRLKAGHRMILHSVHLETFNAEAPCLWLARRDDPTRAVASLWMDEVTFVNEDPSR